MARKQDIPTKQDWKAIFVEALQENDDAFRRLLERIVQEVLEADMDQTLGAEKSERTASRQISKWLLRTDFDQAGGEACVARAARSARSLSYGDLRTIPTQREGTGGFVGGDVHPGSVDAQSKRE